MVGFLARRTLQGLLSLFLLQTVVFFSIHLFMSGDFVSQFAMGMSTEQEQSMREQLGLNLPLGRQYLNWVGRLTRLDLGRSFYGYPVVEGVLSAVPRTAVVFVTGLAVAYLLGSWLGRVTAWRGAGLLSDLATLTAITFYAFFPPALVFVLRTVLGQRLQWLPDDLTLFMHKYEQEFTIPLEVVIQRMALCLPIALSLVLLGNLLIRRLTRQRLPAGLSLGLFLAAWAGSWFTLGIGPMALQAMQLAAIPTIAFVLLSTGEMMVIARTSMAETLDEQYIQTAQAKGLKPSLIRDRHAGRNALLPLMSRLVISLPYLLGGLAIIESAVGWPGMGTAIFSAAQYQDVPVVLGYLLLIGALVLLSQLFLEVLYAYLDPRVRFPTRERR